MSTVEQEQEVMSSNVKHPTAVGEEEWDERVDSVGNKCNSIILPGKLRDAVWMATNHGKDGLYKPHDKYSNIELCM